MAEFLGIFNMYCEYSRYRFEFYHFLTFIGKERIFFLWSISKYEHSKRTFWETLFTQ